MSDNLVKRLLCWEEVWPEDFDKEEGHLYYEAAGRIEALERELDKWKKAHADACKNWQQQCEYERSRVAQAEAQLSKLVVALHNGPIAECIDLIDELYDSKLAAKARAVVQDLVQNK